MIIFTKTDPGQTYGQLKKGSVFLQPEPRKEGIPLDFTAMAATDCNPGRELGNCSTYLPPPYTRSECEAACRNNPLCAVSSLSLSVNPPSLAPSYVCILICFTVPLQPAATSYCRVYLNIPVCLRLCPVCSVRAGLQLAERPHEDGRLCAGHSHWFVAGEWPPNVQAFAAAVWPAIFSRFFSANVHDLAVPIAYSTGPAV